MINENSHIIQNVLYELESVKFLRIWQIRIVLFHFIQEGQLALWTLMTWRLILHYQLYCLMKFNWKGDILGMLFITLKLFMLEEKQNCHLKVHFISFSMVYIM